VGSFVHNVVQNAAHFYRPLTVRMLFSPLIFPNPYRPKRQKPTQTGRFYTIFCLSEQFHKRYEFEKASDMENGRIISVSCF